MSNDFNTNTKNNDECLTPPELVKSLGVFDLDPCQPVNPPFYHAENGFNVNDDGLSKSWSSFDRMRKRQCSQLSSYLWQRKHKDN